ncbi:hypothetical protein ACFOU2_02400 [Bacillus songklensis]|uniref:Uncharacterized protein n=1 Tax=Bacillus songklensis TaxID=1069116 RepID=A0ABV8AZZ9_9BACI
MFRNVKGVKIREYDKTVSKDNFSDKMFEIEYRDNEYLHQMIFLDFLNINVKDLGHSGSVYFPRL